MLWTADHVSALIAAIDWQQVGAALLTAAKVDYRRGYHDLDLDL